MFVSSYVPCDVRSARPVSISRTMRSATSAVMSAEADARRQHLDDVGADELDARRRSRAPPRGGRPRSSRPAPASRFPARTPGRARRRRPSGRPAAAHVRERTLDDLANAEVAHVVHEERRRCPCRAATRTPPAPASSRAGRSARSGSRRRCRPRRAGTSACHGNARRRRPRVRCPCACRSGRDRPGRGARRPPRRTAR